MRATVFAAVLAAIASSSHAANIYSVGNSLTYQSLTRFGFEAAESAKSVNVEWQIKSGTGLAAIWADPSSYTYTSDTYGTVDHAIGARGWDLITLQPYHETVAANRSAIAAMTAAARSNPANANTPVYIFESWAPATGIAADGIHYTVNYTQQWNLPLTSTPSDGSSQTKAFFDQLVPLVKQDNPNVRVIPTGTALVNLETAINAGQVPELASIGNLYVDGTHFDNVGRYFDELVWYSTIFKQSPQGQPVSFFDQPDGNWPQDQTITPTLAADLQRVAWSTVYGDARTGVAPEPASFVFAGVAMIASRRRRN